MKRIIEISLLTIIITIIIVAIYQILFLIIVGKELTISFVASEKHTISDLKSSGYLNAFEWIIISDESQRNIFEEQGYTVPKIDFNNYYLIISRYKISKLYRKVFINPCTGVNDGRAIFVKEDSNNNYYYFYLMPKIMLSQGVG